MDVELGGFLGQNSTYDYDEDYEYKDDSESGRSEAVLLPILFAVVMSVGLLGHCLLLAVLVLKRKHWSSSDTFILQLGVADILLLLTLPFWAAQAAHPSGWYFGGILCKISGVVFNMNFYCGVLTLVCISFNQRRTAFPNSAVTLGFFKKPVAAHHICLIVSICCVLLTIPDWNYLTVEGRTAGGKSHCVHDFSQTGVGLKILARLLPILLGFLVPAIVLVIFCCMLLQVQSKSKGEQKQRVVGVILPPVVVLLLCWVPYSITVITDTIQRMHETPSDSPSGKTAGESSLRLALMYTAALGCVHACLRPLLYFGTSANFRKWTVALLRCESHDFSGSFWELCVNRGAEPVAQSQEAVPLKPQPANVMSEQCGSSLPQC